MANDPEQAFDTVVHFSGRCMHQGNFIYRTFGIHQAGKIVRRFLVGQAAGLVQHAGLYKAFRVQVAHGTSRIVENDIIF